MGPLFAPTVAAVCALLVSLAVGYLLLRRKAGAAPWPLYKNPLPLLAGLLVGFTLMAIMVHSYAPDRFYTATRSLAMLGATAVAIILIYSVEILAPRGSGAIRRFGTHLGLQVLAAAIVVWAGVRFSMLSVPGEGVRELGAWAAVLTVVWLILATNVVRLLDGIHGAASLVLLVASLASLYSNIVNQEFFLAGFALVCAGAAAGSLRFAVSARRLPLEGGGTALIGFLFAILTVLARQKAVAALLLLVPVVLLILVAGAAMLGLLEKRLILPRGGDDDSPPDARPPQ